MKNGTKHDLDGRNAEQVARAHLDLCYRDLRQARRELFHTARSTMARPASPTTWSMAMTRMPPPMRTSSKCSTSPSQNACRRRHDQ